MKVVINRCFGGFGISVEALLELIEMKSDAVRTYPAEKWTTTEWKPYREGYACNCFMNVIKKDNLVYLVDEDDNAVRAHQDLVSVVERLGDRANGNHAKLKIVEIPFDSEHGWSIEEYDGMETISEDHQSWE